MKKFIIAGIIIFFGCALAWALVYYNATKVPYSPKDLPEPYFSLADHCIVSGNIINPYDNCCLSSLMASMRPEVDPLTIVPYSGQTPDCSSGFMINGYRCPMSFKWCEKID